MASIANRAQAEAWNGYEGEHWAAHDDRFDAVNGGFNSCLFEAAGIGERDRVLDIGCGNGQVTRLAARRACLGSAAGIDLSAPMLARAQARAAREGIRNVRFEQGDAQVHPFPRARYDVVLSRFGIMFFTDPVAAFANIGKGLRVGGRLAFLCSAGLAGTGLGVLFEAMAPDLPRPTGPDGAGPTSMSDPQCINEILSSAGFLDINSDLVAADQSWGRDVGDATEFFSAWGPVKYHMDLAGPAAAGRARAALATALRDFAGTDGVKLPCTSWLVTARWPEARSAYKPAQDEATR
jgi:SAM-dependent methyltransferase